MWSRGFDVAYATTAGDQIRVPLVDALVAIHRPDDRSTNRDKPVYPSQRSSAGITVSRTWAAIYKWKRQLSCSRESLIGPVRTPDQPRGVPRPGDRSFGSRFIEHMRDAFEALAQARSMAEAGAR